MVHNFGAYTNEKYAKPHDVVVTKEESIRNPLAEAYFILTEINQKGLLHSTQLSEFNLVLLTIAESVEGFDKDEKGRDAIINIDM